MSTAIERRELAEATMAFVKAFDAWVRRASVSQSGASVPRLQLLNELHCNGPRKMAELADTLGVTPRAVTALVDGLEAEHLVTRTAHPTDRRVTMVEIQPAGATTVEQGFGAFQSAVDDVFAGLPDADVETMTRTLGALRRRIGDAAAIDSARGTGEGP